MSFFGMGGLEILLIGAVALFVLGPKRLIEGIRDGRKMYSDLKRQRDTLQSLITEAIDLEDLKEQIGVDEIKDDMKSLEEDLKLDQVGEELRGVGSDLEKSVPRNWKASRPPVAVDSDVRKAIPSLDISGGDDAAASGSSESESLDDVDSEDSSSESDEVKS